MEKEVEFKENKELEQGKEENNKIIKRSNKRNIVFHIVAILCIAMYGIALAPKVLQNDTYYTIKIGEYIYNNGVSNLTRDLFSWRNLPYTYPHWL